jgi:Mn-containing catalase
MFISVNQLANQLPKDKPDNLAANALQEGLGGQFGEMRTMMQYLFQNFNFRGKAKPYQDLIKSVASEEIGHVELISTTIGMLLEGSTNDEPPNKLPCPSIQPGIHGPGHTFTIVVTSYWIFSIILCWSVPEDFKSADCML